MNSNEMQANATVLEGLGKETTGVVLEGRGYSLASSQAHRFHSVALNEGDGLRVPVSVTRSNGQDTVSRRFQMDVLILI